MQTVTVTPPYPQAGSNTFDLAASQTLTVAQLNHGDVHRFRLRNGQLRTFILDSTRAWLVEQVEGGIVYAFECQLRADGQPLTLRRYVCSQESFYEPWVINGVRIWFSSSRAIFPLVPIRYPDEHDKLDTDAVLALQDATLPICPEPMRLWFPIDQHFIDVGQCFNGDDPWLGPYLGRACHMGLDVNLPVGTPHYAPIDFDDQWIFSADHRWRGVRRWDNGDIWGLQSHHIGRLLVDERTPVKAGSHYATGAGKAYGAHPHAHFEFRLGPGVLNPGRLGGTEIDPWILFWQMFETDRAERGELRAVIDPLSPATTGRPVCVSAAGSRAGSGAQTLRYYWTFGDGGWSNEANPQHTFVRPGVYPVTLVVDDGQRRATQTQHLTVNGEPVRNAALVLHAPDEVAFRPRPVWAADVYGWPERDVPHTLHFTAVPHSPFAMTRVIQLKNAGQGVLPAAQMPTVTYLDGTVDWLRCAVEGEGNRQQLALSVAPVGLAAGHYEAIVDVRCPGVVNENQGFRIALHVRPSREADEVIIDDRDEGCYATPFCWVGHQFIRCPRRGHQNRYLTNGRQNDGDAIVRYTPDLAAGRYEVLFHPQTPFVESSFLVRIRHASDETTVRFEPGNSDTVSLGVYDFAEGTDGFVEIQAKGSKGLVVADALVFRRITGAGGAILK